MKRNGKLVSMPGGEILPEVVNGFMNEPQNSAFRDTPLRSDAYDLDDDQKIKLITKHFREILYTLGLDLQDDSLKDTAARMARMYVKEIFSGLNPKNKPNITLFENKYCYRQMLVEKNIALYSSCEHHFVPIIGKVHVAYIPTGKIIGLSKIHRIVQYYSQRPQVQERLTVQIAGELKSVLETEDVAVVIDAMHLCTASRGIRDTASSTVTAEYCGDFSLPAKRDELMKHLT